MFRRQYGGGGLDAGLHERARSGPETYLQGGVSSLEATSFTELIMTGINTQIVQYIQNQPRQFAPLIEQEMFMDVHPVASGIDPDPRAPRRRICRVCAAEVLLFGLREWWVRERKKGFLEPHVLARPDCPDGTQCARQKNHGACHSPTFL